METLSDDQIKTGLEDLPGWALGDGEIFKEFVFANFREAIAFINRIAEPAEAAGHHPDLENHYNRVRVALHSWDAGGITERDLALARAIEAESDSS